MNLGVVVLNWNGLEVTPLCLRSLLKSSLRPDWIVVVDNASTDGSVDLIRQQFPQVILLANERNLGFAGGCNVGIRFLLDRHVDFILLLNNDAEVGPNALHELMEAAEAVPAAAYTGTIFEKSDPPRVWFSGGVIDPLSLEARHFTDAPGDSAPPRSTDFITGCCLLFRSDALKTIGLLDTSFFAYYEDVDWCLRARAAGNRLLYVPQASIHHEVSHSFRRAGSNRDRLTRFSWAQKRPIVLYLTYRNRLLLAGKHALGSLHRWFLKGRMTLRGLVHATLLFTIGERARARAVLHGLGAGLFRASAAPEVARYI